MAREEALVATSRGYSSNGWRRDERYSNTIAAGPDSGGPYGSAEALLIVPPAAAPAVNLCHDRTCGGKGGAWRGAPAMVTVPSQLFGVYVDNDSYIYVCIARMRGDHQGRPQKRKVGWRSICRDDPSARRATREGSGTRPLGNVSGVSAGCCGRSGSYRRKSRRITGFTRSGVD